MARQGAKPAGEAALSPFRLEDVAAAQDGERRRSRLHVSPSRRAMPVWHPLVLDCHNVPSPGHKRSSLKMHLPLMLMSQAWSREAETERGLSRHVVVGHCGSVTRQDLLSTEHRLHDQTRPVQTVQAHLRTEISLDGEAKRREHRREIKP